MTRLTGGALRVTVLIGESDTWHHKPLYTEIVHRAHAAGLAGASVFRGIEGFGGSALILDDCEVIRYAARENPGRKGEKSL
ncbi:hypothetical protein AQJ43_09940 [Streptomyces avermitilis]|uniref:Uncharacterized protein n=2 Tax=Streptomyces avermitilis TaxID=33903 RepID=Q82NI2_STRAW|nr:MULTISPECIES: DUF190 domain-containing protein [Streptomyces]KUN55246.1 hypothetical protein AQJ43_09940 [Streptomyces avermitilis]MYS96950.1 hypothetical protein [Streptomyces sp. SID5469]OOV26652.1 hypothetical protein SM007_22640 [Streptomyces avermitilis]BAC69031.1 hypothetical protein SAVERM_1321 [Streptomyces avermitilis MA-4680 = NBRC 14893]BBJ48970.1 hypothetical protein SAVMC3_15990 [Streptomyces avermitilis]